MRKALCESKVDLEREKEKQPEFKILSDITSGLGFQVWYLYLCVVCVAPRVNAKNKNK